MSARGKILEVSKVLRFMTIYGLGKTIFKILGRVRPNNGFSARLWKSGKADIGIIGCGQFAFATIGFSIWRRYGNRFAICYDINVEKQRSFASFFGLAQNDVSAREVIADERVRFLYIASNHASHTDYAVQGLLAGKVVYLEKPISVSIEQLQRLNKTIRRTSGQIFAGYNRPFSAAVRHLYHLMKGVDQPLTLNCFISGHVLGPEHWYRKPEEGTRVCGNVGHWLDLAVHMLCWSSLPDKWGITTVYSNAMTRDEDMAIVLTSERGDLVNIILTARGEPFEGINETINIQQGDLIAKIDDFRQLVVWQGDKLVKRRFWPKDVGHHLAILQPFSEEKREWREVELSTLLMLCIARMVVNGDHFCEFSFSEEQKRLTGPPSRHETDSAIT